MATISVCMIVKNEEAQLARCLESLGKLPDEIIVVDTGSTDKTKEVAQRFTSRVYDYEWADDFAAARNFSLSKAQYDYVYVAEADEVMDEENLQRFSQLKAALQAEVEVVEMGYVQANPPGGAEQKPDFRAKLFRRLRPAQFIDPLHEALRTDPIVYRSNVVVQYHPVVNTTGRDLAHFARLVAKKYKFSSRLEVLYARALMLGGTVKDFRIAAPFFEMLRTDSTRPPEVMRRAACVLARGAALEKDVETLMRVAAPELVGSPSSEICCALGDYYLATGQHQQAADWFAAALSGARPELVAVSAGSQPLKGLAYSFEMAGDLDAAKEYIQRANDWDKNQAGFSGRRGGEY